MQNPICNAHFWEPIEADDDGEPVFKMNRQLSHLPLAHVRCCDCGCRTWFTEEQWLALEQDNDAT